MFNRYILKDKKPIRVEEEEADQWCRTTDTVVIAKTQVSENVEISTVFLGVDYSFGYGNPLVFETMIFGGEHDTMGWRYSTWEEAEKGRARALEYLQD